MSEFGLREEAYNLFGAGIWVAHTRLCPRMSKRRRRRCESGEPQLLSPAPAATRVIPKPSSGATEAIDVSVQAIHLGGRNHAQAVAELNFCSPCTS